MKEQHVVPVTGTDIWYFFICKRQTWLMTHRIAPDSEDENMDIGRFIHEYRYGREKKEIEIGTIKIDRMKKQGDVLVVQEIKKSSRFIESATYQLLYYLQTLRKMGIEAKGELLFPEERRKESVELTDKAERTLNEAVVQIQDIANLPFPPKPVKINFCRNCAYREYCWAEDV